MISDYSVIKLEINNKITPSNPHIWKFLNPLLSILRAKGQIIMYIIKPLGK